MKAEILKKLNEKIKFAEKNNEKSVYLNDMKDAKKSRNQEQAEIAISGYKKWKRS